MKKGNVKHPVPKEWELPVRTMPRYLDPELRVEGGLTKEVSWAWRNPPPDPPRRKEAA